MNVPGKPSATAQKTNPYVGPRPFRSSESDRFFGRGREARDVRSLWMAERVLVLHGPPAVGKTSLLNAGVLPLLANESQIDVLAPGRLVIQFARPLAEAPPHNSYTFTLIRSWSHAAQWVEPGMSISEFLREWPQQVSESGEPNVLLAAIDQFEELSTSFPARYEERERFVRQLGDALNEVRSLRLLLLVRDDHLGELAAIERRMPYPFTYVRLDPLTPSAATDAVCKPLNGTGRSFAEEVAEELVDILRTTTYTDLLGESATLQENSVAPLLLQIVCSQLWSSLPPGLKVIRRKDLRRFGDVDQAIIRFYETAVHEVELETEQPEGLLRSWIESTFITEHGTRGNAYRGFSMTSDMPNRVVDALTERHILVPERRALGTWYELSQDRLIGAVWESNQAWRANHGEHELEREPPVADPASFRTAAEEALSIGNYPSARRFAQVAASRYRESGDDRRLAQTLVLEGDISRAEGDLDAARENLRAALSSFSVLQDNNSTARTLLALAEISLSTGDYMAAEDFQMQALRQHPASIDAFIGLGYAQWYSGSPADAEINFNQALNWDPRAARALAGRGQVRVEMREYALALADLDSALDSTLPATEEVDVRSARAVALAALGRTAEADRELALARSQDPHRARTHLRAGRVAAALGRPDVARREFEAALEEHSALPTADRQAARRMLAALTDQTL